MIFLLRNKDEESLGIQLLKLLFLLALAALQAFSMYLIDFDAPLLLVYVSYLKNGFKDCIG